MEDSWKLPHVIMDDDVLVDMYPTVVADASEGYVPSDPSTIEEQYWVNCALSWYEYLPKQSCS